MYVIADAANRGDTVTVPVYGCVALAVYAEVTTQDRFWEDGSAFRQMNGEHIWWMVEMSIIKHMK